MYISGARDVDASQAPPLSFPFVLMHGLSIVISKVVFFFLKKSIPTLPLESLAAATPATANSVVIQPVEVEGEGGKE